LLRYPSKYYGWKISWKEKSNPATPGGGGRKETLEEVLEATVDGEVLKETLSEEVQEETVDGKVLESILEGEVEEETVEREVLEETL
jgi:hypothetical protein